MDTKYGSPKWSRGRDEIVTEGGIERTHAFGSAAVSGSEGTVDIHLFQIVRPYGWVNSLLVGMAFEIPEGVALGQNLRCPWCDGKFEHDG